MRTVAVGEFSLHCLKLGTVAAIAERGFKLQVESQREMLRAVEASDEIGIKQLDELYKYRGTRWPAIQYAMTINGAMDVIKTACEESGVSFEAVIGCIAVDDVHRVALELIGQRSADERRIESGE